MVILGHENPDVDSIVSGIILNKVLLKKGIDSKFIIPDKVINNDTFEFLKSYGINAYDYVGELYNDKYILVDHNERSVDGEVVCIIDHHKTLNEISIDHYYNTEFSSTACFIAKECENLLDTKDLELAVLATMIDTVSFHSTKGRKEDEEWCKYICDKYDLDYLKLYSSGLYLTNMDDLKLAALNGLKKYVVDGKKIESSYIQIKSVDDNGENINKIINFLKEYILNEDLFLFVFIVHDMDSFKSMYYMIERGSIISRYYDKYEQRGNVIMPEVFEYIRKG